MTLMAVEGTCPYCMRSEPTFTTPNEITALRQELETVKMERDTTERMRQVCWEEAVKYKEQLATVTRQIDTVMKLLDKTELGTHRGGWGGL